LGYQWAVKLTTLGVSMMFFNAFIHKMAGAHFTLRWALSDNLRNHLLVQFDKLSIERTPMADWLLQAPWRYETAAMLNLVSQFAPILAFLLFKRPLWRALAGFFFLMETLALGVVMDLWNLNWLPLMVVFIDWDWLFAKLGWVPSRPQPGATELEPDSGRRWARSGRAFTITYVSVLLITGFVPWVDTTLKTYPFSRFPMFSKVRAKQPYGTPQTYEFYGNRVESVGHPLEPDQQRELDRKYSLRWLQRIAPDQVGRKLTGLEKTFRKRYKRKRFTHARAHLVLFQAVAPPEPARLELHRVGIIADKPRGKPYRTLRGKLAEDRRSFTIDPVGFDGGLEIVGIAVVADDMPGVRALELRRDGERYLVPELGADSVLVLADVSTDGQVLRFVVGRQPAMGW
ncbi:MAG: hypothetical protein KJO07_05660, partial [Deltaproteobacteria bacterium]|nr:hypothetical protein [Deltaproteobacteria bacterium]